MPQNKKPQAIYGLKHAITPAVADYLRGREHLFTGQEIGLLHDVAANPNSFHALNVAKPEVRRTFADLYSRQPNEVLMIMLLIRETLAKQQRGHAGKVRHYLLTHATDFKNDLPRDPKIAMADLVPGAVAENLIPVSKLLDKEIAGKLSRKGLKVLPESVKTERKKLARELTAAKELQKSSAPSVSKKTSRQPRR